VRADLHALGTQVAFVHMQRPEEADRWFERFGLADVPRFSDPTRALYRAFRLEEGSLFELGHPRLWSRWVRTALSRGAGRQGSNWRQLTGVFLLHGDRVLAEIRHSNSAARPDYVSFARVGMSGGYNN
jgi:hypothetical protein